MVQKDSTEELDGQHINRIVNTAYHALSLMGNAGHNVSSTQSHSRKGGRGKWRDRRVCGLDGGSGSCVAL